VVVVVVEEEAIVEVEAEVADVVEVVDEVAVVDRADPRTNSRMMANNNKSSSTKLIIRDIKKNNNNPLFPFCVLPYPLAPPYPNVFWLSLCALLLSISFYIRIVAV